MTRSRKSKAADVGVTIADDMVSQALEGPSRLAVTNSAAIDRLGVPGSWAVNEKPSFMIETHGGGLIERVAGFDTTRAMTGGFDSRTVSAGTPPHSTLASPYGAFRTESVQGGHDDRVIVQNPASAPWRSICHLVITRKDNSRSYGTGWFVGPKVVVTAGHCIFDHRSGWAVEIVVIPGRQGDFAPFGYGSAIRTEVDPRWVQSAQHEFDYGALLLPDDRLGRAVGWFGFGVYPDSVLESGLANNAGYPDDKPFGTMWFNAGRIKDTDPTYLYHLIDTAPGQSGSPLFRLTTDNQRIVVGIHTGSLQINRARRVSPDLHQKLTSWAAFV